MAERPLAGTRVLDLSRMVSGPLCGRILADLGADVVKIEPPDGDRTRSVPPHIDGLSPYFAQMNAGKRSVCIDLKAAGGPELAARLAAGADVFVENFRPGVLARFGLDAATLLAANPKLVYCSVTGWGQQGPWRDRRAYAPLVHADVGTLELTARRRGRRPEQEINQHGDVYTALLAANAVLAALLQRMTTGRGQHLDVSMGEAAVYVNEWAATDLQEAVDDFAGFDTWNHFTYRLGDGSFVALIGDPAQLFPIWAPRLGASDELLADPRFATDATRRDHVDEVVAALEELTSRFADFDALDAVLDPWMLAAQVRSVAELAATEWASQRDLLAEAAPGISVPASPWKSSESEVGAGTVGGELGADGRAVLADYGFSDAEIDAYLGSGALCHGHREVAGFGAGSRP
jgi:crotonobetainyl-CoA:carnitine CoA-transferase CaiB-like acyl-CoA transferase